ncbi:MAG: type II secretion system secretin GspD [Rhodospirillales bacterium]
MSWIRAALIGAAVLASAQQLPPPLPPSILPPGFEAPRTAPRQPQAPKPKPPAQEQQPAETQEAKQPAQAPEAKPQVETQPVQEAKPEPARPTGTINVQGASLVEMIELLARELKINYILDPRVKGSVTLNTYGETRPVDTRALLETILQINGATMVQVGEVYRIVPMTDVARLPMSPQVDPTTFPEDGRLMLNLIFLKFSTVEELSKLLEPFIGEGARMMAYSPANLLLILDNSRNMKRTMELIALFDSDTLAGQRVRLFEVKHSRPSDIARELDAVLKSISLNEKASTVRFLAVDRINTVVAIAPNPGAFRQVEEWLKKLDIPQKATAGTMDNYVYRVKYGMAPMLAQAIMQLYLGFAYPWMGGYGDMYGGGMYGAGMYGGGLYGGLGAYGAQFRAGMYSGGPYGGGIGAGMYGAGMYGGMMGGGMYGGIHGLGMGYPSMYGAMPMGGYGRAPLPQQAGTSSSVTTTPNTQGQDLTGSYLGGAAGGYAADWASIPRVIPNPFDNTLLIHASPQDYEQILKLLEQLDVPPRQVLVEARIYEVDMEGMFAAGVQAALLQKSDTPPDGLSGRPLRILAGQNALGEAAGAVVTAGALVGNSKQLLALLTAAEDRRQAKLVSAPTLIATDSIPASMNVGDEVPTLAAQAVSGSITDSGSSVFTQAIQNKATGVTLNVLARVNPSGIITLVINQDVSAPVAPSANAAIQSPSFSHRTVQTQITLQDGDTIAIAGIIQETDTSSSAGVPVLHRIPVLGAAFGAKSINKKRTEMVIFMTPRIIYDTNQLVEASDQLKSGFKRISKVVQE